MSRIRHNRPFRIHSETDAGRPPLEAKRSMYLLYLYSFATTGISFSHLPKARAGECRSRLELPNHAGDSQFAEYIHELGINELGHIERAAVVPVYGDELYYSILSIMGGVKRIPKSPEGAPSALTPNAPLTTATGTTMASTASVASAGDSDTRA